MLFKNITILDENLEKQENMYVGIKGREIQYIGNEMPKELYGEQYEGRGKMLMSGFYNAHGHSPMMLMRGYGENMVLQDWLDKRIFPFEAKLTGDAVYWATSLAMAESLKFGIISTSDMYYFCEDMVRAVAESGAKNNICRSIVNFSDQGIDELSAFQEAKDLFQRYHNAEMGRIKIDMSLHGEYTSNPKTVKQLADYTKKIGTGMQVHISETQFEHEECKKRHGLTPTQYLNDLGLLDSRTTAAHCVWVENEDFDILKEKGVTVASCPVSNMKLASGICNVPKLHEMGINVAIGTDSVASNNSLNFLEEMKVFAIAGKTRNNNPTLVTPIETLRAATIGGAKSQGRKNCGKLAVGCKADLIVMNLMSPNMQPIHDLANNVVYSANGSDVILTMVDGKVLYEDGAYKTIDVEKAIYHVNQETDRILGEL
ncbi:MAG: amidohydrolase [Anaerovorax sp.]